MRVCSPRTLGATLIMAAILSFGACVPGGTLTPPTRGSDLIGTEEIEGSSAVDAYELVRQVRPNWLRGRGQANLRGGAPVLPVVYFRTQRQGSVDILRGIPTIRLLEMRFIDATTATTRYGNGHSGGVIEVMIRRR